MSNDWIYDLINYGHNRLAWIKLPCPGDAPIEWPDNAWLFWYREHSDQNIYALVGHSSLPEVFSPGEIPTLRMVWTPTQIPKILTWERVP
jgi:hypothetical protein